MSTLESEIRAFIVDTYLHGDASRPLTNDTSLIENDLVDSTGILELVAFVEERYGLTIEDVDILPENFASIGQVAAFVERKTAQAA